MWMNRGSSVSARVQIRGGVRSLLAVVGGLALASAASCDGCDGGGRSGGSSGSSASWLVGQSALMINVDPDVPGKIGHYPLRTSGDLLAIACFGKSRAWVAGDGGTLLTTDDAGATWRPIESGVTSRLRALTVPSEQLVYVAGDDGVLRISADAGRTWQSVPAPAVALTSVAARADGSTALLTSADGKVWRLERGVLAEVAAVSTGALHAVALADNGAAVAVGDGGAMLVSSDSGAIWRPRPTGTARNLHAVRLVADGQSLFAVGDGGVLVEGPPATAGGTPRVLGQDLTLRAINLQPGGHGTIVGDQGLVLVTRDFGATWSRLPTAETRNIYAADALGDD
jgi:photosystem II stability/assembly factor-like uncharacterized protein